MGIFQLFRLWGWRQWLGHPLRTGLCVVGVALGVAMLSAVTSINNGITQALDGLVSKVSRGVDLVVGGGGMHVPQDVVEQVAAVDGVAHAAGVLEGVLPAPALDDQLLLLGVDLLGDTWFLSLDGQDAQDDAVLAEPFAFLNSAHNVLLPAAYARRHGLGRGDNLTVVTPGGTRQLKVFGLLDAQGAAAAADGAVAVMSVDAARLLLGQGDVYSRVDVAVAAGRDVAAVQQAIQRAVGSGLAVAPPAALGVLGREVTSVFRNGLFMSSFVALLVALGIISNAMRISVVQRRRELGILRATGATRAQVLGGVVVEAVVLGAVGGALGAVFGWALARGSLHGAATLLSSAFVPIHPDAAQLGAQHLVVGMVLGMVASALAAASPALDATRVSPVSVMGRQAAPSPVPSRVRAQLAAAAALLAVATVLTQTVQSAAMVLPVAAVAAALTFGALLLLTPLGMLGLHAAVAWVSRGVLPLLARLSLDNLTRSLATSTANVGGLAVAVLVVAALGSFVESFAASLEQWAADNVSGDLVVSQRAVAGAVDGVALDGAFSNVVEKLPGVDKVVGVRLVNAPWNNTMIKVRGVAVMDWMARARPRLLQGAPVAPDAWRDGAAVSESLVARFGVKLGDTLSLNTPDGVKQVRVVAVLVDYVSTVGSITLDQALFQAWWKDGLQDALQVFVAPGADVDVVRRAVLQATPQHGQLLVASNAEYRARVSDTVARFFHLTRLLILLAMVVAVLGLINTLQASVLDRTRELGVLRATGATAGQVQVLLVLEAVWMAAVALLLGSAAGLFTGAGMVDALMRVQTGWFLPRVVPWETLGFNTVLTLFMAALAAWWPARRAAAMRVVTALAYE